MLGYFTPLIRFTNSSNHPIGYHGQIYPTAEHRTLSTVESESPCDSLLRDSFAVFQAFKFMKTDSALAEHIRRLPTARMARQEARKQAHRQRTDWLEVNVTMMDRVLKRKFLQHRSLRRMLRDTGSRELIEDSPVRALPPSRGLPSSSECRMTGSGGLGMMAGDVTSSVKDLCDYGSDCKLVKGIDVTLAQIRDVFVEFCVEIFPNIPTRCEDEIAVRSRMFQGHRKRESKPRNVGLYLCLLTPTKFTRHSANTQAVRRLSGGIRTGRTPLSAETLTDSLWQASPSHRLAHARSVTYQTLGAFGYCQRTAM